ncbi:tRNA (adenosine(37)-N6)-threonylcarbamoyltransferase complex transferase subunit TsaD [Candidatus Gottesmanbacteria bacterium RIFCSPHIGHO2_02_FULL_39_14]|uniref:tRNA N6-adenosine threonylcarbamoyltransferase n=2 Tax=Candidatus Gottesmaniibacteriota TaxID=1752720 RepID=A0A1F6A2C1_9BACT|nr:MAG: tRNA (adenosine(37)-N6)-threonylcarbamoyltransferase complex transferase subunit TsaD [Candidatus Gottesmanbacteria bacterium RIFCSPHIGHO2_02_FULL_39_14]OGG31156.1 MAG: tRNA (adenosine(37)-N6)-threonylcarbamoyltransferase complex transferase subunit TsaD [Candidatus Gottesmanbacteria bacterium RIFCSPLOWO2_02_FULL_38_8]
MKILAIETSCDETAAAVIENGKKIISNVIASSAEMHQKTGGIIPETAAREQVRAIIPVIDEALNPLRKKWEEIDSLAVTIGPGLIGSLLVGVETAKTLSLLTGKPLIPVNHVLAHLYANFLNEKLPEFPAIGLVVSGGHTELFVMEKINKLKWVGGTIDDAAGEAFDKTARLLGLGFPGGPAIAAEAAKFKIQNSKFKIKLPRPMINDKSLNFSFSGLKTAVLREVNKLKADKQFNNSTIQQLAYEIQEAITDVLVEKTLRAAKKYKVKSILLGGGVAANKRLAERFKAEKLNINLFIPLPSLCTDNAAYIGSYAYFFNKYIAWQKIEAKPDLAVEVRANGGIIML